MMSDSISQFRVISRASAEILKDNGIDIYYMGLDNYFHIHPKLVKIDKTGDTVKHALLKDDVEKYNLSSYCMDFTNQKQIILDAYNRGETIGSISKKPAKTEVHFFFDKSNTDTAYLDFEKYDFILNPKSHTDKITPLHNTRDLAVISQSIAKMYEHGGDKMVVDEYLRMAIMAIATLKIDIE